MITRETHDPMLQNLALLPQLESDPARAERVRARCRAQLVRNQPAESSAAIKGVARWVLGPVLVGSVCILYIAGLVRVVLYMHGGSD
jgi:hypothetical protein